MTQKTTFFQLEAQTCLFS